jgi:hypothetical protein
MLEPDVGEPKEIRCAEKIRFDKGKKKVKAWHWKGADVFAGDNLSPRGRDVAEQVLRCRSKSHGG